MLINLLSLYLFISVIALSIMFVYSFSRGRSSFARAFGALALTLDIYLLGYLLELNVATLDARLFWNQIQYFGIPFFPGLWLLVSMLYTGKIKKLWSLPTVVIFVIPILTLIIRATNSFHHLFYANVQLSTIGTTHFMLLTKGPWYMLHILYVLITLILSTLFYYQRYIKSSHEEKQQFRLLLFASIIPYLALILVAFNFGGKGIDYTALILPPCIMLINIALARFNFLEIKLTARERVFEVSHEGLLILDKTYVVKDFNPSSGQFFNWLSAPLGYTSIKEILVHHPIILSAIYNQETITHQILFQNEIKYICLTPTTIKSKGQIVGHLIAIEDVTIKEQLTQQLLEMARTDALTEINNRRFFVEEAEKALERAQRYQDNLTILMLDIDFFKKINDTYGHACGDAVLRAVAHHMKKSFRGSDICGRVGGEEFAIVMLKATPEEAFNKAERFRLDLNNLNFEYQDYNLQLSISIGIAHLLYTNHFDITLNPQTLDELISRADKAMYEAKAKGRNRVCNYEDQATTSQ